MDTDKPKSIQPITPRAFWGLAVGIWFLFQLPLAGEPFRFLATFVHELGHGLGAMFFGGTFERMFVFPNFSGLAETRVSSKLQRVMSLFGGLLGPSLAGGFAIIVTRWFYNGRYALYLLTFALLASGFIWAGDGFTRITLLGLGAVFFLLSWKLPKSWAYWLAHVVGIAFCLNAVADFNYFFSPGGVINGTPYKSDMAVLTELLGGFRLFWALLLTAISLVIMYVSLRLSGTMRRQT